MFVVIAWCTCHFKTIINLFRRCLVQPTPMVAIDLTNPCLNIELKHVYFIYRSSLIAELHSPEVPFIDLYPLALNQSQSAVNTWRYTLLTHMTYIFPGYSCDILSTLLSIKRLPLEVCATICQNFFVAHCWSTKIILRNKDIWYHIVATSIHLISTHYTHNR